MMIRYERESDRAAIAAVMAQAFAGVEHSDHREPEIVEELRRNGDLTLSLVAIERDVLVGHVAFSPVTIDAADRGWFGLGPVSVRPDRQGAGIGAALIRAGLEELRTRGAAGCVVLGEPHYYGRFGFERDDRLHYEGAPPEYFMRLVLIGGEEPVGCVDYAAAFSA